MSKGLFLKLSRKEKSTEYAKGTICYISQINDSLDDLWIVSTNPDFSSKNNNELLFIARSVFHGPTRGNYLEVILVLFFV